VEWIGEDRTWLEWEWEEEKDGVCFWWDSVDWVEGWK